MKINPEDVKRQIMKLEGFSDGIKSGGKLMAEWFITELDRLEKEESQKIAENKEP